MQELVASDPRAEHATRLVRFEPSGVTIVRRFAGVRMQIRVPARCYRGVLLERFANAVSAASYRVRLDHRDDELSVPLFEAPDSADIIAEWAKWASFFALPRLVRTGSGSIAAFDGSVGPFALGKAGTTRKRGRASLASRRARFLVRRKPGPPSAPPLRD